MDDILLGHRVILPARLASVAEHWPTRGAWLGDRRIPASSCSVLFCHIFFGIFFGLFLHQRSNSPHRLFDIFAEFTELRPEGENVRLIALSDDVKGG